MKKIKDDFLVPKKIKIDRVFINKANGQMTILLPKKKVKSIPSRVEVTYW